MVLCALLGLAAPRAAGQTSPRDLRTSLEQTGTAVIRGRVLAGDTGKPLRQARLTARARELAGPILNITTDADGRYEIAHLPPGEYTIIASCGGYHDLVYGQRRPLERSKAIEIGPGQVVDGIDFTLLRMSVISGRVTDETGDPVAAATVVALRTTYSEGRRRLVPFGKGLVRTDDTGQYPSARTCPGDVCRDGFHARNMGDETIRPAPDDGIRADLFSTDNGACRCTAIDVARGPGSAPHGHRVHPRPDGHNLRNGR